MEKPRYIRRVCGFYVSEVHLITMMLPYIKKQLELGVNFSTFLETNLKGNVKLILEKIVLADETKKKMLGINWSASNVYKYLDMEREVKKMLRNGEEINVIITGNNEYIKIANENLNKVIEQNENLTIEKDITIINCYEVTEFNDNIRNILNMHNLIINTSGIHEVEEVFEGYERKMAN